MRIPNGPWTPTGTAMCLFNLCRCRCLAHALIISLPLLVKLSCIIVVVWSCRFLPLSCVLVSFVSNVPFAVNCCHIFFLPPYVIMYSLYARYASLEKKAGRTCVQNHPQMPRARELGPRPSEMAAVADTWRHQRFLVSQKKGSAFRAWTSQTRLQ